MKSLIWFCGLVTIVYSKTLGSSRGHTRCVNMWDEGCINGQLNGAGNDDNYLNGGFTPGKRCVNMWDEGCINGQLNGAGNDDNYLNGGFTPGKRCVNMWDEGCINGQLNGAGNDDNYLNGGFTPGKRCVNMWDEGCINGQLNGAEKKAEKSTPGSETVQLRMQPGIRWDEEEVYEFVIFPGGDDNYLNGGFNPGKRSLHDLLAKLQKHPKH